MANETSGAKKYNRSYEAQAVKLALVGSKADQLAYETLYGFFKILD